jgi:hypothetical protein
LSRVELGFGVVTGEFPVHWCVCVCWCVAGTVLGGTGGVRGPGLSFCVCVDSFATMHEPLLRVWSRFSLLLHDGPWWRLATCVDACDELSATSWSPAHLFCWFSRHADRTQLCAALRSPALLSPVLGPCTLAVCFALRLAGTQPMVLLCSAGPEQQRLWRNATCDMPHRTLWPTTLHCSLTAAHHAPTRLAPPVGFQLVGSVGVCGWARLFVRTCLVLSGGFRLAVDCLLSRLFVTGSRQPSPSPGSLFPCLFTHQAPGLSFSPPAPSQRARPR